MKLTDEQLNELYKSGVIEENKLKVDYYYMAWCLCHDLRAARKLIAEIKNEIDIANHCDAYDTSGAKISAYGKIVGFVSNYEKE